MASVSEEDSKMFNAVLALMNVRQPWSEATPGVSFPEWWRTQFYDTDLPPICWEWLDQQLEWVTGISNRAATNGLLKPSVGLSAARVRLHTMRQPYRNHSEVKLVFRPVHALHQEPEVRVCRNQRLWAIYPAPASSLHFAPVFRHNIKRSHPSTLRVVYPKCDLALAGLDAELADLLVFGEAPRCRIAARAWRTVINLARNLISECSDLPGEQA
jgi:hypothetical protein